MLDQPIELESITTLGTKGYNGLVTTPLIGRDWAAFRPVVSKVTTLAVSGIGQFNSQKHKTEEKLRCL